MDYGHARIRSRCIVAGVVVAVAQRNREAGDGVDVDIPLMARFTHSTTDS